MSNTFSLEQHANSGNKEFDARHELRGAGWSEVVVDSYLKITNQNAIGLASDVRAGVVDRDEFIDQMKIGYDTLERGADLDQFEFNPARRALEIAGKYALIAGSIAAIGGMVVPVVAGAATFNDGELDEYSFEGIFLRGGVYAEGDTATFYSPNDTLQVIADEEGIIQHTSSLSGVEDVPSLEDFVKFGPGPNPDPSRIIVDVPHSHKSVEGEYGVKIYRFFSVPLAPEIEGHFFA